MKTYLDVPFAQKEKAYRLGARWDDARKRWYCPDGVDLAPLMEWVPGVPKLSKELKKVLDPSWRPPRSRDPSWKPRGKGGRKNRR